MKNLTMLLIILATAFMASAQQQMEHRLAEHCQHY
jgi:hypothetical protein